MLFLFLVTKFCKSELFSCLQKVDHVINYWKRPVKVNRNLSSPYDVR